MKTRRRIPMVFLLLFLSSCRPEAPTPGPDRDQITQVSVINALMLAQYDGVTPMRDVLRWGDFGLGTLDRLDGELIVLDGRAYQVRGDGVVAEVEPARTTPFVVVTPFDRDAEFACPPVETLTALDEHLDTAVPQRNHFVAIRIDGRFGPMLVRSAPRQERPYKPLSEAAKDQSEWTFEEITGTLVGIRSPSWVGGLNVPGYHWHFLSDDRKRGGHVLKCRVRSGRVAYDVCRTWTIQFSDAPEYDRADVGKDLSRDLRRVESPQEAAEKGGSGK